MPIYMQPRRGMGEVAPLYPSLWVADLKALLTPGNVILPSDLQAVKDKAAQEIRRAGGSEADAIAVMQQIDRTVAGVAGGLKAGGSSLAPFSLEDYLAALFAGDPNDPNRPPFAIPWLLIGAAGLLLVVLRKL